MKAIVTGASGFVGKAVCDELTESGYEVTAIVRDENLEKSRNINAANIVSCQMSEYRRLSEVIEERRFDVLYHFAWSGTSGSERGNYDIQLRNIRASCELAEQCAVLKCKRFVYAASIMECEIAALMESDKNLAISSVYSTAKLAADNMVRAVTAANNIEYIRAVISNIYGAGESSPRLINTSIRKLLKGEHCSFSAGEQMYDFIYITDAAKIFVELGKKGKPNKTYYIGSRSPQPLKYFFSEMRDVVAPDAEIGLGDIPFDGISLDYSKFDTDAVYNDTGLEANVTFAEGIKLTADWIKVGN